jgi:predicted RNA-binding Zn-ribbon protein involved in translation (DUF1610 family)
MGRTIPIPTQNKSYADYITEKLGENKSYADYIAEKLGDKIDGEKEIKNKKAVASYKCPNCGANITIMMHGRTLNAVKCEYCGGIVGTI